MKRTVIIGMVMALAVAGCGPVGEPPEGLQRRADELREEGKTLEALNLYNQAIVSYQQNKSYDGILSVLSGRLISWQHLFNRGEDKVYAIFAKKEAESMREIAAEQGIHSRDHLIHFLLGKSDILLKDFASAEVEFQTAIDLYPVEDAEKGEWSAHLGEAMYRNGKKEQGVGVILAGVEKIEAHDVDTFRKHVWISGAYLRLAKLFLSDDQMDRAKEYLNKAEQIIQEDARLVVRKEQLENLKKKMS